MSIVFFFLKALIATLKLTLRLAAPGALSSGSKLCMRWG